MHRRKFIVGCGSAVALSFAGCLGTTGMDEHKSSPGSVASEALTTTGYGDQSLQSIDVERSMTVEGHTEEILVVNHVTGYTKEVSGELQGGKFHVFTSPNVSVAGVGVNPLESMDTAEILQQALKGSQTISDVEHDEDTAVIVLGEATKSSRYTATAVVEGVAVDVYVRVTEPVPTSNDDLLMTIAVYPQHADVEDENALTLAENTLDTYEPSDNE